MLTISTIAAIATALVIGLAANHYRCRQALEGGDETSVRDPLKTLAVLLVAFVMVMAAQSYDTASQAASSEAHRVDQLYEVADYAPEPQRERLQAAAVCYARAILAYEWPQMDKSHRMDSEASVWSSDFRRHFKELAHKNANTFEILVDVDDQRSAARQTRLHEASPAIPPTLFWFMTIALAATIGAFAFGLPCRRRPSHVILLCVLAALFTGSLLIVEDIDRPFSGYIRITSEAMADTTGDISSDFAQDHPGRPLPCDIRGARTGQTDSPER
ncbi:bestrophin-like domain [Streptomyces marianii]|uniref:DUF4239 domain-containing protein n=1 Tax=Streptomyces marianii TaxID=1817406 RepID=A0A5R9DYC6_9ACTN|nr:DUF4239 domain-containing protein [Streptomyces marianii]TLQ42187.1 DUF4239 domain-containing protein [Streptomyces marianii]